MVLDPNALCVFLQLYICVAGGHRRSIYGTGAFAILALTVIDGDTKGHRSVWSIFVVPVDVEP